MITEPLMTLCLGHSAKDQPNGCEKAGQCQRHLALRARDFPHGAPIIGCACVKQGHPLFIPVTAEA